MMNRLYWYSVRVCVAVLLVVVSMTGCAMRNEEPLKICFIRNDDVWVMDEDGGNLTQLTFTGTNEWPSWSPDGKYIVYGGLSGGHNEIFLMESDGSNNRQLTVSGTDENCYCPTWTPDGNNIVYNKFLSTSNSSYIVRIDKEGNIIQEYYLSGVTARLYSLSVSYDGSIAAYCWGPPYIGIFEFKTNSNNETYIAPTQRSVSWMPQKKILTYRGSTTDIMNHNIEEATTISLLSGMLIYGDTAYLSLSWSSSGRALCFASNQSGEEGIYVYDFDTNTLKRITSNTTDKHPCFIGKPR